MEQHKTDSIVQFDESFPLMLSDDEERQHWNMRFIYRVPAHVANLNLEAYQPQVVSFGPYHHGEPHLVPMEAHKRRACRHFIKRSRKPFDCFLKSLTDVARHLEESYDKLDQKWKANSSEGTTGKFLELMITDGCFMLEILRALTGMGSDYASNDPIFSSHGKHYLMSYIMEDMLMLENQLPMLVLDQLVAVESDGTKDYKFVTEQILMSFSRNTSITGMSKCLHVLDVFRNSMLKPGKKKQVAADYSMETLQLASATELSEHGIRFQRSKTDSLDDISFTGGVLTLPTIWVDDSTKSRFLNLMAFERSHATAGDEVMSYIYCMDHLISNGRDIALLCAQGIILNILYSDEAAAKMFSSLAKSVIVGSDHGFIDVLRKVNKYYNKSWNMWRANFIHTYLRNPWVALSLIAAVFLFALTTIQTVYSVLGYHK